VTPDPTKLDLLETGFATLARYVRSKEPNLPLREVTLSVILSQTAFVLAVAEAEGFSREIDSLIEHGRATRGAA